MVDEATRARGAISAPYRYHGFPAHCCTSVNDVVCHGIPEPQRVLSDGDIVNVDVTTILDGFHGDTSRTFFIGEGADARKLVEVATRSLELGIAEVRDGARLGDIGAAIQEFAEPRGCSVVRDFVGHGIGRRFHTAPAIPHYGKRGAGERLQDRHDVHHRADDQPRRRRCEVLRDGWTAVTADGSLSAQFEHTLVVTETGVEVLTLGSREQLQIEPRPSTAAAPDPLLRAGGLQ